MEERLHCIARVVPDGAAPAGSRNCSSSADVHFVKCETATEIQFRWNCACRSKKWKNRVLLWASCVQPPHHQTPHLLVCQPVAVRGGDTHHSLGYLLQVKVQGRAPPHVAWMPTPCVTFRLVVAPLRGPGRSPVLPFACCVGSLLSVGRCGRCSCWCRFRVRGAQ